MKKPQGGRETDTRGGNRTCETYLLGEYNFRLSEEYMVVQVVHEEEGQYERVIVRYDNLFSLYCQA